MGARDSVLALKARTAESIIGQETMIELCCRAPAGVRGWVRDGLGTAARRRGARARRESMSTTCKRVPSIGQHGDDVLCEAGYFADEMRQAAQST